MAQHWGNNFKLELQTHALDTTQQLLCIRAGGGGITQGSVFGWGPAWRTSTPKPCRIQKRKEGCQCIPLVSWPFVWVCMEVWGQVGGEEIPLLFPGKPCIHFVLLIKEAQRQCEWKDECVTLSTWQKEKAKTQRNASISDSNCSL